ncbi:MAG: M48 family metallopeptidase [Anaerolineae bacterium]|nr:M48 family metallopeptidase [Anaerolineae bacterium]
MIVIIVISPLLYWLTDIGQTAGELGAAIIRQPDGTLISSPKAQAYHQLSLPMRLERMVVYPILLLAFYFSGMAVAVRQRIDAWVSINSLALIRRLSQRLPPRLRLTDLLTIGVFICLFNLALFSIYLPFNFYRGFIVAHQFGLSTQTLAGWFGDWGKSVAIELLIAVATWTTFYSFMKLLPRRWPLPVGGLMVLFLFVFALLTPIIITPLFYEVSPLTDNDLRARILNLGQRAGVVADEVYVIDASSKTTQVNAYVTAFGDSQQIVLYDTLIDGYSPDEVEVVLAHELGHWYYHHVFLSLLGVGAVGWLGLFGLRWLLDRLWPWLRLRSPADIAGLPLVLALVFLANTLALPIENGISRFGEHQADVFALTISQKPDASVSLFEQLAEQNLSIVEPPAWEKFIFYTHPSVAERIRFAETFDTD